MGSHSYLRNAVPLILLVLLLLLKVEVESGGELGTIECLDGKWKIDTRLMALVMTCPLPLDGNPSSVVKMLKCALNKLGIYDGERLSDDFIETTCSAFSQKRLQDQCLSQARLCATISGLYIAWETTWPAFGVCILPWIVGICNI